MKTKPQRLFQVLITDQAPEALTVTDAFKRNIESLKSTYPDAEYRCYGNDELLDFLAEKFPETVLQTYRALAPYAFKADLARYCLLFVYGGLYSDLSYLHLRPIEPDAQCEMVVFRDIPGHVSWAVSNAIIYAQPNSPILERAIARVVEHFRTGYYGYSALDPTGPYMLGRVLAETADWTGIRFGDSQLLNVDGTGRHNAVKVMPTGEIVAIRNKTINGQITDLVVSGGNDYIALWREKRIWGEPACESAPEPASLIKRLSSRLGIK